MMIIKYRDEFEERKKNIFSVGITDNNFCPNNWNKINQKSDNYLAIESQDLSQDEQIS